MEILELAEIAVNKSGRAWPFGLTTYFNRFEMVAPMMNLWHIQESCDNSGIYYGSSVGLECYQKYLKTKLRTKNYSVDSSVKLDTMEDLASFDEMFDASNTESDEKEPNRINDIDLEVNDTNSVELQTNPYQRAHTDIQFGVRCGSELIRFDYNWWRL